MTKPMILKHGFRESKNSRVVIGCRGKSSDPVKYFLALYF